jgi:hypothetical protein
MGTTITIDKKRGREDIEPGDLVQNAYGSIFYVGYRVENVEVIKTALFLGAGNPAVKQPYGTGLIQDLDKIDHPVRIEAVVTISSNKS